MPRKRLGAAKLWHPRPGTPQRAVAEVLSSPESGRRAAAGAKGDERADRVRLLTKRLAFAIETTSEQFCHRRPEKRQPASEAWSRAKAFLLQASQMLKSHLFH